MHMANLQTLSRRMITPPKPTASAQFHAHPTQVARHAPKATPSVCIVELGTYGEAATNATSVPASQAKLSTKPKTDRPRVQMVPSALLAPSCQDAKPVMPMAVPASTVEPGTPGTQATSNALSALTLKASRQTQPTRF